MRTSALKEEPAACRSPMAVRPGQQLGAVDVSASASLIERHVLIERYGPIFKRLVSGSRSRFATKQSQEEQMTAALATNPRRTRDDHPRLQRRTDGEVYAGIADAWWLMHRQGEHREHLMRTHLVRPGFAKEVWGRYDVDPQDVLTVCALIVTLEDFRICKRATQTTTGTALTETFDPRCGWWHPLRHHPEMGIHFWQLVLVVELRCIAPVGDPPPLQYGRFGERDLRTHLTTHAS
jgi:hypothetical protein